MEVTKITIKKDGVEIELHLDNQYYTVNGYIEYLKKLGIKVSSPWIYTLCEKKELEIVDIYAVNGKIFFAIVNNYSNFERASKIGKYQDVGRPSVIKKRKLKKVKKEV